MVESRQSGGHSLQHLVNELSRIEEGLRRARALMGEEVSHDEAGVKALEHRRDELHVLIAKRQGRSRSAAGDTAGDDPQKAHRVMTTIR